MPETVTPGIINNIQTMNANLQQSPINPNLEKFYKGFNHYSNLNVEPEQLTFTTAKSCVVDAYKAAERRINQLCLPLSVHLPTATNILNVFIVKPIADYNSFERLTEMAGVEIGGVVL